MIDIYMDMCRFIFLFDYDLPFENSKNSLFCYVKLCKKSSNDPSVGKLNLSLSLTCLSWALKNNDWFF